MLNSALEAAIMERTPIWAAGAGDWWDFTRSGRAKRGMGAMPAETRASDGWVENEAGLLVRRSPNTRSMAGKGLLTFPGRTNLLTYSEQFDNAAWTRNNIAAFGSGSIANAIAAPDGTTTADKIVEAATTATHNMAQNATIVSATVYTYSVYAKAAERSWICLEGGGGGGGFSVWFNLATGAVGAISGTTAGNVSIVALPNGWYRCIVTDTSTSTSGAYRYFICDADNNQSYTGNGTSGLYLWGAQLEMGSFASPPIVNATGSPLTANGPQQVLNLSGKLNTGFGFVFRCNVRQPASGSVRLIEFYQSNHAVNIYNAGGTLKFDVYASGVQTTSLSLGSWAQGRNTFAAAVMNGYAMARRVGDSAPVAGSGAYSACANAGLLGAGAYDGNNTYGFSEQFAAWYGPMSAHFFDNVLWPKAQLLAQVA